MRSTTIFVAGLGALALFAPLAIAARPASKPPKPNKVYVGTAGADTWTGTERADRARGRAGDDTLTSLAGNDRLWGNQGVDTLVAGDGADFVWPGVGADTVDAGAGNDRVFAGDDDGAIDTIGCGDGIDRVVARHDDVVAADCETVVRVGEAPAATPATGTSATTS